MFLGDTRMFSLSSELTKTSCLYSSFFVAVPVSSCMVLIQSRSSHLQNIHRAHTVPHPHGLAEDVQEKPNLSTLHAH